MRNVASPSDRLGFATLPSLARWRRRRRRGAAGSALSSVPIEQVFAKLKTLLRKTDPRTIETTWRQIGALLDCCTPEECANYLTNAGYASA